jgi:hypothetical protein
VNVVTTKLINWIRDVLAKLPLRSRPYLLTDLNSQLGLHREAGAIVRTESATFGALFCRGLENHNGNAFRKLCEDFGLLIMTTTTYLPPSFHSGSTTAKTRIDHIAVPKCDYLADVCHSPMVLTHFGRSIQLVKTPHIVDHLPVCVRFSMSSSLNKFDAVPSLNRDAIMRCVLFGKKRYEFVAAIESKLVPTSTISSDNSQIVYKKLTNILFSVCS